MARRRVEDHVGEAVRRLRAREGLTLAGLAERSGVSSAMISKIERGQVSASLSSLDQLAAALSVPIANLFAASVERREISFVRAGEGMAVQRFGTTYGHDYRLVGKVVSQDGAVTAYEITIAGKAEGQPLFQNAGIELIHVLTGGMRYRIGDEIFELGPGDTITFEAEAPHGPEHLTGPEVRFLTIVSVRPEDA